jgi:hypothetical protein
MKHALPLQT